MRKLSAVAKIEGGGSRDRVLNYPLAGSTSLHQDEVNEASEHTEWAYKHLRIRMGEGRRDEPRECASCFLFPFTYTILLFKLLFCLIPDTHDVYL